MVPAPRNALQVINPASGRLLKQLVSPGDSRPGQEVTALLFTNLGTPHRTVLATGWDRKVRRAPPAALPAIATLAR
jgi:hypothetical protein